MKRKQLEDYILSKPGAKLDYPFGQGVAVYKVQDKMFAFIAEKAQPLRVSLKCEPVLAETLREKYESVMPGYHLNKKHWNTLVLSGQLDAQQVYDLVDHSYQLAVSSLNKSEQAKLAKN